MFNLQRPYLDGVSVVAADDSHLRRNNASDDVGGQAGQGGAPVQVHIILTPRVESTWFQILESTVLSSHWFQIPTCTPTAGRAPILITYRSAIGVVTRREVGGLFAKGKSRKFWEWGACRTWPTYRALLERLVLLGRAHVHALILQERRSVWRDRHCARPFSGVPKWRRPR